MTRVLTHIHIHTYMRTVMTIIMIKTYAHFVCDGGGGVPMYATVMDCLPFYRYVGMLAGNNDNIYIL